MYWYDTARAYHYVVDVATPIAVTAAEDVAVAARKVAMEDAAVTIQKIMLI